MGRKNLINILSMLVSLIGVILAVYFYLKSQVEPDLVFVVNSSRSELRRHAVPGVTFAFNGKLMDEPAVTVAHVAVWNRGRRSIWARDVLQPLQIKLLSGKRILSASLKGRSRPEVGLRILSDTNELAAGRCRLDWKILETNDGDIIQLIYTGASDESIIVEGTVEGQRQVRQSVDRPELRISVLWAAFFFFAPAGGLLWLGLRPHGLYDHQLYIRAGIVLGAVGITCLLGFLSTRRALPPFPW